MSDYFLNNVLNYILIFNKYKNRLMINLIFLSVFKKGEFVMVSEAIEFVTDCFDETFEPLLNKKPEDERIISFKKYINTLSKMRKKRCNTGSVIVTLQVMDSFKYLEQSTLNIVNKIENGEIKIHNNNGDLIADVIIASFGNMDVKVSKDKFEKKITTSGWKGSIEEFINIIRNYDIEKNKFPGTNGFYLKSFPEEIIKNKSTVEYIIFGLVVKNDEEFYDTAAVNIVGLPSSRNEDVHIKNVLTMFGY